jgi:nucleoside-diphosphate-sugar epimerase
MKNVIITGPTGMVGNLVVQYCLTRKEVGNVTIITRRKTGISHDKVTEVVHSDFMDYSRISEHLKDQDVVLYCIGVYSGTVPANEFTRITVDYTRAFATEILKHSTNLTFCFLSGAGADQKEKSGMLFARTKGAAENFLLNQKFEAVYIFRPTYIYPVTPRKEPTITYQVMRVLYPVLSRIYPNIGITSKGLARVIVDVGLRGGNQSIYENSDIRRHLNVVSLLRL